MIRRENTNEECMVCVEVFDEKKRVKIVCPFCEEDKPSACRECVQTYLLNSVQEPHCMACKHTWSIIFFNETFPKAFIVGKYRKNRQEKALEREKGRLAEAMPLVERRKRVFEASKEFKAVRQQMQVLRKRLGELERIIRRNRDDVDDSDDDSVEIDSDDDEDVARAKRESKPKKPQTKTSYMFKCSVGDCKGLIEGSTWKCGICETKICNKCHMVLGKERKDDTTDVETTIKKHECKKEDVETAKNIVKETKPCPKCNTRIYKIEGCDQMFCVMCHTPFSWKTGQVVTGTIHNPHYYELQRKLGRGQIDRVVGDVPCGGLQQWHTICRASKTLNVRRLKAIHRLTGEVTDYLENRNAAIKETLELRILYLMGEIDDKTLKRRIFLVQRHNDKVREIRNVLETYRTTMVERFTNLVTFHRDNVTNIRDKKFKEKKKRLQAMVKELEMDADRVVEFCNGAMKETLLAMGYTKSVLLVIGTRFGYTKYNLSSVDIGALGKKKDREDREDSVYSADEDSVDTAKDKVIDVDESESSD